MVGKDGFPWYRKSMRAWYVWHEGKQVRLHGDKTEAYRLWHQLCAEATEKGPTVDGVLTLYLDSVLPTLKPSTQRIKNKLLRPLIEEEKGKPLDKLDGNAWLNRHPKWGRSYRWLAAFTLKTALRWAKREGHIADDPLETWEVPGPKSRGEESLISEENHNRLISVAPDCYRDALTFLRETGCRPCEMCALEAGNVKLDVGVAILAEHKTERFGKPRVVILSATAVEVLRKLIGRYPSEGKLFRNTKGEPLTPDRLRHWIRKTRLRLKIKGVVAYGYRHTLATDALLSGVPIAHVAELLGHSGTQTLNRHYSHLQARLDIIRESLKKIRGDE